MSSLAFGVERYLIILFLITNIRVKTLGFIFIAWLFLITSINRNALLKQRDYHVRILGWILLSMYYILLTR